MISFVHLSAFFFWDDAFYPIKAHYFVFFPVSSIWLSKIHKSKFNFL